jgi:cardiolipin synthase
MRPNLRIAPAMLRQNSRRAPVIGRWNAIERNTFCLASNASQWTQFFSTIPKPPNEQAKPNVYKQLVREAFNVPNTLTLTRLVLTPGLAYLIWIDQYELAIVSCFFTGILDWLDGYFARKWNQFTVLGSFLDPLADKVFVGALLGTLTVKGLFPWQLATLVIGRDVALLGGSFIYRGLTKPKDVEFFATTGQGVIEVKPTFISKVNTVLQMSVLGFALTKAAYGYPTPELFSGMCWIVAGSTIGSGLSYVNLAALRNRGKSF